MHTYAVILVAIWIFFAGFTSGSCTTYNDGFKSFMGDFYPWLIVLTAVAAVAAILTPFVGRALGSFLMLTIEKQEQRKTVRFGDLNVGQAFLYAGENFYVKRSECWVSHHEHGLPLRVNAILLPDMNVSLFEDETQVSPIFLTATYEAMEKT